MNSEIKEMKKHLRASTGIKNIRCLPNAKNKADFPLIWKGFRFKITETTLKHKRSNTVIKQRIIYVTRK